MLSFIIPTRDRPDDVLHTLDLLGRLAITAPRAVEVIVIDNASSAPMPTPPRLANGWSVERLQLDRNHGTAARNIAARHASGEWLVMLDDDSAPVDLNWVEELDDLPARCAALAASIVLRTDGESPRREAGGLPAVFIGCGVAIRRDVFLELGGYDERFGYYAEEYDFCAKLLLHEYTMRWSDAFIVHHRKVAAHRDMNVILERLIVNNSRVIDRYAPSSRWQAERRMLFSRCQCIAEREDAHDGYERGIASIGDDRGETSTMLSDAQWAVFNGTHAAMESLRAARELMPFQSVRCIEPDHITAKHRPCIEHAIRSLGLRDRSDTRAEVDVIATLSPGPMLDTAEYHAARHPDRRIILPWMSHSGALI